MKRLPALFLTLALLMIPMSVQAAGIELDEYFPIGTIVLSDGSDVCAAALPETGIFDPENPGYGAQLGDAVALLAYQALETQLAPGVDYVTFDVSHLFDLDQMSDAERLNKVYTPMMAALSAFVFDHPESQYCSIEHYGKSGSVAVFIVTHRDDGETRKQALEDAVSQFTTGFDTTLPAAQQYRIIHDYICDLAVYNYEAASAGVQSEAHTAFGLLVDGDKVVCEGYSKAFKVLCDAVELPCMLIAGEGNQFAQEDTDQDGQPDFSGVANHMWNAVRLDGAWYAVDTTWDDIDGYTLDGCPDLELSMICHNYFLNNAPFLEGSETQDHRSSGNIYFANSWPMAFSLPTLTEEETGMEFSTDRVTLTILKGDLTIPDAFWPKIVNGVYMSSIRDLTFRLTQDIVLSESLIVPADFRYTIDNADGLYNFVRGDGFTAALFSIEGALHLTGSPHTCLDYTGGLLTVGGETITQDLHWYGACSDAGEEHLLTCSCGETSYTQPHSDADQDLNCDLCGHAFDPGPSVIQSLENGIVTFRVGADVTSVDLCVAGYENGKFSGVFFLTIPTVPDQIVTQDIPLTAESYKVFLLRHLTFAPLCEALSSAALP